MKQGTAGASAAEIQVREESFPSLCSSMASSSSPIDGRNLRAAHIVIPAQAWSQCLYRSLRHSLYTGSFLAYLRRINFRCHDG